MYIWPLCRNPNFGRLQQLIYRPPSLEQISLLALHLDEVALTPRINKYSRALRPHPLTGLDYTMAPGAKGEGGVAFNHNLIGRPII